MKESGNMQTITIDIETITPGWTPPEKEPDKFGPVPEHLPVVISWLLADPGKNRFELHTYVRDNDQFVFVNEREALEGLARDMKDSRRIVTWNGRGFDMPLLGLRAMAAGIDWSHWPAMSHRYGNYKKDLVHYDLMDLLGDQGGVRAMPMDSVARLLGLPGKHDISGKDVSKAWSAGEVERIVRYCQEDVVTTYLIYLRWAACLGKTTAAVKVWATVLAWAAETLGGPWKELATDLAWVRGER
jgi:3'-5' exonuclease